MFVQLNQAVARAVVGTVGTAVCAAVCLFGATAPARAGTVTYDNDVPTAKVVYTDLDLTRAEGRATLERRLRTAARAVCSVGVSNAKQMNDAARCIRDEVANGMRSGVARAQVAAR